METLSMYVAQDRRQALADGRELPDRTSGAALVADISGFTPMTEALARALGPRRGAEELTQLLNVVYDALIAVVDQSGGSVIGFAGDSITCWFDDRDGAAPPRAIACASAMQLLMRRFDAMRLPDGSTIGLAVKVAIASGFARRFVVGDPVVQRLDVLAGATVARMASAEQLARKHEIVVDEPTLTALGGDARASEWRAGEVAGERFALLDIGREVGAASGTAPLPPAPLSIALPDADIQPWLPMPVYDRLCAGLGEFLTELRPAVALFLRFSGIDYDADADAGVRLDAYIRRVQEVLARYEGTLVQLTIGDKGSYFCAAFGAPIAHEDDARRAVIAALELRDLQIEPRGAQAAGVQIGLSQGMVRAGAYGGATRRTYGVLGDAVNTAARLMSHAAPHQILSTAQVVQAAGAAFHVQELEPVRLKGIVKPLAAFAVRGRRSEQAATRPARTRSALVGRASERSALSACLQELVGGRGSTMIIVGEAGVGKSRLVQELLAQAQPLGVAALLGAGEAMEQATIYHAWRPVFRALFGLSEVEDVATARRQVSERLAADPELLARAPLLNPVLLLGLPENELTLQLVGELRSSNTREILLRFLIDAARAAPTLLVLEDAHWLDSASWALVEQLRAKVPALLLVIATRPLAEDSAGAQPAMGVPDEYRRLLDAPETRRIQLSALSQAEVSELIGQRLGVAHVPQPVIELIRRTAEGHPYFSEEIAYALRDTGVIQIDQGVCSISSAAGNLHSLPFPHTIQGVITSRLDRLPPTQQLTLKVASVIGQSFRFRELRDIHPVVADRIQIGEQLENLARLDITPLQAPEPDLSYAFKHAITREVTYQLLLFSQRRSLHRAAAEWHEQVYADNLPPYYALLAYHWSQAVGNAPDNGRAVAKAIGYLEQAGDQALQASAYRESVEFFSQALELDVRQPPADGDRDDARAADAYRRARWMSKIGHAYDSWGHFVDSKAQLEQAAAKYGEPMPGTRGALIARLIGQLALQVMHRVWPARFVARAAAGDRRRLLEIARVYKSVGEMAYFGNQREESLYAVIRMLNVSEVAGPSAELALGSAITSLMLGNSGLRDMAEGYHRRALAAARAINDPTNLAEVLRMDGFYRIGMGQWPRARDHIGQALAIHARLNDKRNVGDSLTLLSQIAIYRGEYDQALSYVLELSRAAQRDENPWQQIWSYTLQGLRALRMGQMDDTIALMQAALVLAAEHAVGQSDIYCRGLLALAQWRSGDEAPARQLCDHVAELIAQSKGVPVAYQVLDGYLATAEVYLGLWEQQRAQHSVEPRVAAAARQACRALHSYCRLFPIGRPSAWLFQGLHDMLAGRPTRARKAWQTSLAAAEQLEMPYEEAQAHYQIGRHLPAGDPARDAHLRRAGAIFERLGAAYDLQLVRSAIANGTTPN